MKLIVSCFVVGMLLTPPDVISQALLALPMWMLFEVGILASRVLLSNKDDDINKSDTKEDEQQTSEDSIK